MGNLYAITGRIVIHSQPLPMGATEYVARFVLPDDTVVPGCYGRGITFTAFAIHDLLVTLFANYGEVTITSIKHEGS
jgi:hypothetical protein